MIRTLRPSLRLFALSLLLLAPLVAAQPLLTPLPAGDLSKLPAPAQQELRKARADFDQARVNLIGEGLAQAYVLLGAQYARVGVLDVARVALANATALAPFEGRWFYLSGVFQAQAGDNAGARTALLRALELDQAYLPIRYRLAQVQVALNDTAAARATLAEILAKRPELAPAHAIVAEAALKERQYPEAIAGFERALRIDPNASALYALLAQAKQAQGDAAGAAAARAKAGAVPVAFADPLLDNIYQAAPPDPVQAALQMAAQGRTAAARSTLDAALTTAPNDPRLLAAYARVEANVGNLAAAKARADAALKAAPNDAGANLAQAIVLESGGQETAAVPYYEKAVRADLKLVEARLLLGNVYLRRQQYAAAAEQYRQMTVLVPDDGGAWARLASSEALAGRCADALREVNTALRARPKDGGLLQTYVRLAATCPAASPEEKQMAVDYGTALYRQRPDIAHSEALAMAMAANGKSKDAVDYEAQAIFEAVRAKDDAAVARMQPLLQRFKAGQAATQPWPAGHPFVAPARLAPSVSSPTAR